MRTKVWNTDIRPPMQGNDNWEFASVTVYNDDDTVIDTRPFVISGPKLQELSKQAIGRYLDCSVGSTSEKQDLLRNWSAIEPNLQLFFRECFEAHT